MQRYQMSESEIYIPMQTKGKRASESMSDKRNLANAVGRLSFNDPSMMMIGVSNGIDYLA